MQTGCLHRYEQNRTNRGKLMPFPEISGPLVQFAQLVREVTGDVPRQTAANRTGLSHDTIARMWMGQKVSYTSIQRLAESYGVPSSPLLSAAGYKVENVVDPFVGTGTLVSNPPYGSYIVKEETFTFEQKRPISYATDPEAYMIATAYEGLPPEIKKFVKNQILSAADMAEAMGQTRSAQGARAMERSMTVGGTRADHDDNPSRLDKDRIPTDGDSSGEDGS